MPYFLPGITFLVLFLLSYLHDRRKIMNGMLLSIALLSFLLGFLFQMQNDTNTLFSSIAAFLLVALLFIVPAIFFLIGIILIYNARELIAKEGKRKHNFLALLMGIALIVGWLFIVVYPFVNPQSVLRYSVLLSFILLVFYYSFLFMSYTVSCMIYPFSPYRRNKDFIIVLGCGLLKDKISPLLASRLDRGLEFYYWQKRKKKAPQFIVSGGQGSDEELSEAAAMKVYLLSKGILEDEILMEDQSRNTYENMVMSKELMDAMKPHHRSVFATNNYHVFRAGIYAHQAGLKHCDGIGSRTALYYLPNAFVREFFAVLVMYKTWHIFISAAIGLFAIAPLLLQALEWLFL